MKTTTLRMPEGRCKPRREMHFPVVKTAGIKALRRDQIQLILFRYKNGIRENLGVFQLKGDFLLTKEDFYNLAEKQRFFIQLEINRFLFIIPVGYDNPRFFTSAQSYERAVVNEEVAFYCPDALAERINEVQKIEKSNQMIFASDCTVCGMPFSIGRPVLLDVDAIRSIHYSEKHGLSLIENGVGVRKLPSILY